MLYLNIVPVISWSPWHGCCVALRNSEDLRLLLHAYCFCRINECSTSKGMHSHCTLQSHTVNNKLAQVQAAGLNLRLD